MSTTSQSWREVPPIELLYRNALERLIYRVFSAPFAKTFSAPLGGAAAAIPTGPWYLAGGTVLANCITAWQAKAVASLAISYDNIPTVLTTYDLALGEAPSWDTSIGWTFNGTTQRLWIGSAFGPGFTLKPVSFIARITHDGTIASRDILGTTSNNGCLWFISSDQKQKFYKKRAVAIGSSTSVVPAADCVIAVTYSAIGEYTFYLNGTPDGSGTNDQSFNVGTTLIGTTNWSVGTFKGNMAALAVFNIVLSAAEVAAKSAAMAAL
jgi:hypothetical protein